jgi:threonine synthase
LTFKQAVFEGLASDGGLIVPDVVPNVVDNLTAWSSLSFDELAFEIAALFCSRDEIPAKDLRDIMRRSYQTFNHVEVVPTVKLGSDIHIMELFHGPTFAFKDVALQALGNLYEYFLKRESRRLTVLGATSGDTGSAAIYGLRGKKNVECFILFPQGRVSPIQQQQMTSVLDPNVHCVAVEGTFDDCQDIVKGLFGDLDFKKEYGLGAVNSINWARIMFQITYYFYTYFKHFPTCKGTMSFSVPTGNFGDVLAGYYAKRMGLPVKHLIVATNENDILHRFFTAGKYDKSSVQQTSSPSMDIGISSNFERYLYYLFDSSPDQLRKAMVDFKDTGSLHVGHGRLLRAKEDFASARAKGCHVNDTIKKYEQECSYILDPHTACGVFAVNELRDELRWAEVDDHAMIVLGTAHPAKFGDAVCQAIGRQPELPPALEEASCARTRCQLLPNDMKQVRTLVERTVKAREQRGGCFSFFACCR